MTRFVVWLYVCPKHICWYRWVCSTESIQSIPCPSLRQHHRNKDSSSRFYPAGTKEGHIWLRDIVQHTVKYIISIQTLFLLSVESDRIDKAVVMFILQIWPKQMLIWGSRLLKATVIAVWLNLKPGLFLCAVHTHRSLKVIARLIFEQLDVWMKGRTGWMHVGENSWECDCNVVHTIWSPRG